MNLKVVHVKVKYGGSHEGSHDGSARSFSIYDRLMFPLRAVSIALLTLCASACRNAPGDQATTPVNPDPVAEITAWRAKHEADYRRDFVSIAAMHSLHPGVNRAGSDQANDIVLPASAPPRVGTFQLDGDQVRFEPEAGVTVLLKDAPLTAPVDLPASVVRDSAELTVGGVRLAVHVSGENRSVRVRDPNGPLAKAFLGFTWFAIDPQYRVVGRFIRDAEPRKMKVLNTYNDVDEFSTEGVVEFTLQGETLRLRPFTTRPKRFYFVFRDASSGAETYETARLMYADLRDDGTAVLDFNAAYNPPCAFNQFTTCPIPLKENRLPVKVLAGERAYGAKPQTGS
jgi:uncharacterized protein (DUF1684 family)